MKHSHTAASHAPASAHERRTRVLIVAIAYVSFLGLGMAAGLLGVAWPSIRGAYRLSLDDVGMLLLATTVGSLLSSFTSGPVMARTGVGRFLALCSLAGLVGLTGYALARQWWVMVLAALLVGAWAGAMDAGLNLYFAANHGARLMQWLHACFGLGAALGPVVIAALLGAGLSWRWGYGLAALLQVLMVVGFAVTAGLWGGSMPSPGKVGVQEGASQSRARATFLLPVVWLSMALFLMASGLEASAGQWSYSLFTEARSVAAPRAALWVSVYWGSLTAGRILYGLAAERLPVVPLLRVSAIALVVGSALVWWRGVDLISFLGLALLGLAIAPIFPLLQLVTPQRLGHEHAANAIGFQTAAGYLGISVLPALGGVLAERLSLEVLGPFFLACAVAVFVAHEALVSRPGRTQMPSARGHRLGR